MKLIKKQDQIETLFPRLFDDGALAAPSESGQSWIGRVDGPAGLWDLQASPDAAQLEKAAYESGFREGEKSGLEIAGKKVEALMSRYAETIEELGRLKPMLYEQVEREVVKLALQVARKIVHREVTVDQEIIQTLVRVALSHVAVKSAVTVHLNPADYTFMLEHRKISPEQEDGHHTIVLLADKSIERGGCLVETECGDVDARIEAEFREVERAFFENGD